MPMYDFVCTNPECKTVTEKIVTKVSTSTIDCPKCQSPAEKPPMGFVQGAKRHVGLYFNYQVED